MRESNPPISQTHRIKGIFMLFSFWIDLLFLLRCICFVFVRAVLKALFYYFKRMLCSNFLHSLIVEAIWNILLITFLTSSLSSSISTIHFHFSSIRWTELFRILNSTDNLLIGLDWLCIKSVRNGKSASVNTIFGVHTSKICLCLWLSYIFEFRNQLTIFLHGGTTLSKWSCITTCL